MFLSNFSSDFVWSLTKSNSFSHFYKNPGRNYWATFLLSVSSLQDHHSLKMNRHLTLLSPLCLNLSQWTRVYISEKQVLAIESTCLETVSESGILPNPLPSTVQHVEMPIEGFITQSHRLGIAFYLQSMI